uniref:Uncharacterized protein n=1 Tax=viral metagenome TaxID=1070528 RepID=A0A6C0ECX1_9ZZZZ
MSKKTRKIKNQEGGRNMLSAAKNAVKARVTDGLAAVKARVTDGLAAAKQEKQHAVAKLANQVTAVGAAAKAVATDLLPNLITELHNKYQANHNSINSWLNANAASKDADTKAVVELINLLKTIENAPRTIVAGVGEKANSFSKHSTDALKTGVSTYNANKAETNPIKQKYLKYKQKYLELKQQLNQI